MARKGAKKGEKDNASVIVSRTAHGRKYNQVRPDQKSRRTKNKRIEFVLNPVYAEDRNIIALLDKMRGGDKSDYIREAIALKIENDEYPPIHELFEDMMQTIETLNRTIEDLRAEIASLKGSRVIMRQMQEVVIETDPGAVQSSGIDVSRPRPAKVTRATTAQNEAPEPDELTDAQQIELAQIMAASIRKAQPGRPQ